MENQSQKSKTPNKMVLGVGSCLVIGLVIGIALHNIATGIIIGLVVGIIVGIIWNKKK